MFNGANSVADVTTAVDPDPVAAIEVEVVRVAAVHAQRAGPVEAERATAADLRTVAVARSGEKDAIAVRTGNLLSIYAIDRSPLPRTLVI